MIVNLGPVRAHAIKHVVIHLHSMGLTNPSEKTLGIMSAVMGWKKINCMDARLEEDWKEHHQNMKSHVATSLEHLKKKSSVNEKTGVLTLPSTFQELQDCSVFQESKPVAPPVKMDTLLQMIIFFPLRNRKAPAQSQVALAKQHPEPSAPSRPSPMDMFAMHDLWSRYGGLQSWGQMFTRPPNDSDPLPGLQFLQTAAKTPALEDGQKKNVVPIEDAKPSLPSANNAAQPNAPVDNNQASSSPFPGNEGNSQDKAGSNQPQTATQQQAVVSVTAGAKTCDQPLHGDVPGLDMVKDSLQAREASKDKAKGAGKPKAKAKAKIPSKKPACKQAVLKKPAAAKSERKSKGVMTQKMRFQLKPEGCSTCRWRCGCTNSCWLKRGYTIA